MIVTILLGALGAAFGSFIGALIYRLKHNVDLNERVESGKLTKKSANKKKLNWINGRSICEKCKHKLGVFDLIPILSWIFLRGKCRYCREKIGILSLLIEIGTAAAFVISYLFWPIELTAIGVALLVIWLLIVVIMTALLIYDARWYLLPNKLVFPLIALAAVFTILNYLFMQNLNLIEFLTAIILGMMPIAGLYGLLWMTSRGRWVGFGDVKLGIAIGLLLPWQQGVAVLMMANVLGILVVLPNLVSRRLKLKSKIPFGPFLIIATFVVILFGEQIIEFVQKSLFLI